MSSNDLLERAKSLDAAEKVALVEALLDDLDHPDASIDAEWSTGRRLLVWGGRFSPFRSRMRWRDSGPDDGRPSRNGPGRTGRGGRLLRVPVCRTWRFLPR
ncbi:MAG: addiction module protein [Blastocatellia bacterium]|nr:addiction module protein [Blastocatellia bacterium]